MQFIGVVWVVFATGYALLGALAFAIAFIYAQVTVTISSSPATRGRLARPGLCGAILHHLRDLRRGDHHDRVPAQPRRFRPRADADGGVASAS